MEASYIYTSQMESTALRQLLRSLCHGSQWEYAVFWKLKHKSPMLLTLEDWYCNYSIESPLSTQETACFSETTGIASFACGSNTYTGISTENPIAVAVASMSCLLHPLGEGPVGRVAFTGDHCWIFSDEFYSKLVHECPDEWGFQFAVGIKTILLVPVIPHGVVQLGSRQTITKDSKLVVQIIDMFNSSQLVPELPPMPLALGKDGLLPSFHTSLHGLPNIAEPLAITSNLSSPFQSRLVVKRELSTHGTIQMSKNNLSITRTDVDPQLVGQENHQVQEQTVWGTEAGAQSMADFTAVLFQESLFPNATSLEELRGWEEELLDSAQFSFSDIGFDTDINMNICSFNDMKDLLCGDEIDKQIDYASGFDFLPLPSNSELHTALGPATERCNEYLARENMVNEDLVRNTTLAYHTTLTGGYGPSLGEARGFSTKESDTLGLWDAVVPSPCMSSCDIQSNRSSSGPSAASGQMQSQSGLLVDSCLAQRQSGGSVLVGCDSSPRTRGVPGFTPGHKVLRSYTPKSTITKVVDDGNLKKVCGNIVSRSAKVSHNGIRKVRLSDAKKPRPRDRQMIQDRVKELRELVPNGGKCSIDALLDRTVKHMLFLRGVTKQAEKLKQRATRKPVGRKNWRSFEGQGHKSSTSWAFGFGRQLEVCPIVVEDLEHPGHMLIEVLCQEHRLFLDIAQVLRNLELTILKGAMKNHSDKAWAHFIVEVSSSFDKMDIFWPLMQLLQWRTPTLSMF